MRFPDSMTVAGAAVSAAWLVLFGLFVFRRRGAGAPERARDPRSLVGMALEGVGFAIVWWVRRPVGMALAGGTAGVVVDGLAVLLAAASVWFVASALKTLGRQWSLAARVIEGHALVRTGPYAVVRNPIYSGMLGMLLATGLAYSRWWSIAAAAAIYLVGTEVRVRSEERLLRREFGAAFDAYAAEVPALLPRWPRS